MKNWKKIVLLLIVLMPSFFFLTRAFTANSGSVEAGNLEISGPGGLEMPLEEIHSVAWVKNLPELSGTKSFSLGLIKKGNFLRAADNKEIRVIKNAKTGFIHLHSEMGEVYFNLGSDEATDTIFERLKERVPEK